MEIPKHMARRKTCDQEFFRIVTRGISPKCRIAGARDFRFSLYGDDVVAAVARVTLRAVTIVAAPLHFDLISVMLHFRQLPAMPYHQ